MNDLKDLFAQLKTKKVLMLVVAVCLVLIIGTVLSGAMDSSRTSMYAKSNFSKGYSGGSYEAYSDRASAPSLAKMPAGDLHQEGLNTAGVERKVVKNASLDILVKKLEDTTSSIYTIVKARGGIVDSSDVSNNGQDAKSGTIVVRVPNEEFDVVVDEIGKLAVKVESQAISSEDVTLRFVDLEARLKSKKAVEAQYVQLLQKADKVDEIVSVSQYLNQAREEIEVLQAQMNYLSNQISMSSIRISMTSEAEVKVLGITWKPITTIKQSFRNAIEDLIDIVNWCIGILFALPGMIVRIAIFLGIVWILVKIYRKGYALFNRQN